jgi:hypothetical protein
VTYPPSFGAGGASYSQMQERPFQAEDLSPEFREEIEKSIGRSLSEAEASFCALAERIITDKPHIVRRKPEE